MPLTYHTAQSVEEHLTLEDVAARLAVDVATICRWVKAGKIKPVRRISRRCTRIPASAVNRFLASRTV